MEMTSLVVFSILAILLASTLASAVLLPHQQRFTPSQLRQKALQPKATRYSNDWAVQIHGDLESVSNIASRHGFINMGQIGNLEGYYHFQLNMSHEAHRGRAVKTVASRSIGSLSEMLESSDITSALEQHDGVGYVKQQAFQEAVQKKGGSLIDYTPPNDPNWTNQWSLLNNGSFTNGPSHKDLNVEPAWLQGIDGSGVVVAIVDKGVEKNHRDLLPNFNQIVSYDYIHDDTDPTPDATAPGEEPEKHGTACAGVIGMVKDNHVCGVGVAHGANIAGLKFNLSFYPELIEAEVLTHQSNSIHVYSNSFGPHDNGFTVSGPGTLVLRALETGVTQGREGKGSIYIWSSGNGGLNHDSCAADGYTNSIYAISVGSADQNGGQAAYDETCAGKMAVTFSYNSGTFPGPGETWEPYHQVSTTTLNGECTGDFTGTSASAPLVAATIALVLQANPDLTWRDVQYLIAYTSSRDKLVDGEWFTNGGGLRVSPKFGFGAVDAEAIVTRARRWINVPLMQYASIQPSSSTSADGIITSTFYVTSYSANSISFLEHVVVTMSLSLSDYGTGYDYDDYEYEKEYGNGNIYRWLQDPHPKRGDIQVTLTSPHGTMSTLLPYRLYDFVNEVGYSNWPFKSVLHWSEDPVGTWTVHIHFRSSSGTLTMQDLSMTLYGTTTTPESVSNIPSQCNPACKGACSGPGPESCDVCREMRIAETQECVSSCPEGAEQYKSYCFVDQGLSTSDLVIIIAGAAGGGLLLAVCAIIGAIVLFSIRRKRSFDSHRSYQFQRLPIEPTAV